MSRNGFTLIESLIVLLIISLLMTILLSVPQKELTQPLETRIFFDRVASLIKYQQQLAVLQAHYTTVNFNGRHHMITFVNIASEAGNEVIELPEHITLSTNDSIRYYATGRVNQFRTVNFFDATAQKDINIVFQIGNGQFEIQQ